MSGLLFQGVPWTNGAEAERFVLLGGLPLCYQRGLLAAPALLQFVGFGGGGGECWIDSYVL